jgi:hypothetical protein
VPAFDLADDCNVTGLIDTFKAYLTDWVRAREYHYLRGYCGGSYGFFLSDRHLHAPM